MKFPIGEDRIPLSWLPATHPARKNHMDLKKAAEIVYAGLPGNLENPVHHRTAIAMFDPSTPLTLVHDADADAEKLTKMNEQLGLLTSAIKTQGELLESVMTEAWREVFRDYKANIFLRDQLIPMVEIQMRKVAQHQRTSRG